MKLQKQNTRPNTEDNTQRQATVPYTQRQLTAAAGIKSQTPRQHLLLTSLSVTFYAITQMQGNHTYQTTQAKNQYNIITVN